MKKILRPISILPLLAALLAASMISCQDNGTGNGDGTPVGHTNGTDTTVGTEAVSAETDSETEPSALPADTETDAPQKESAAFVCTFDSGISVTLGGAAADALAALGTYTDLMEAPSCVHEGYDRVYTYGSSYKVTTMPSADGSDYVGQIELLSDLAAVRIGEVFLMIGSSEEDVRAALGEPAEDTFGVQKYYPEGAEVTVIIDGGSVTGLTFAYPG